MANSNILKVDSNSTIDFVKSETDGKYPTFTVGDSSSSNISSNNLLDSDGTLRVKDKITFTRASSKKIELDEEKLKKIKSFAYIFFNDSDVTQGDELCLYDDLGKKVCISKEYLGALTGQTPVEFKIPKPKVQAGNQPINHDVEYTSIPINNSEYKEAIDGIVNGKSNNDKIKYPSTKYSATSFFDKKFMLIPNSMKDLEKSGNVFVGFKDENYYCYLEDKTPETKFGMDDTYTNGYAKM